MGLEKLFRDLPRDIMVLDFFAGDGSGMTKYLDWFDDVTYWEISQQKAQGIVERWPEANVIVGDSFEMTETEEYEYNLILMENDIGIFGDHCENFDAVHCVPRLLSAEGGYVVSHICTNPKLYVLGEMIKGRLIQMDFNGWMKLREIFYGNSNASKEEISGVYEMCFGRLGLKLKKPSSCGRDWVSRQSGGSSVGLVEPCGKDRLDWRVRATASPRSLVSTLHAKAVLVVVDRASATVQR